MTMLPGPQKLVFHGTYDDKRYLIVVDDQDFFVQKRHFRYWFMMAIARAEGSRDKNGGWVKKKDLDKVKLLNPRLYEMRKQVEQELGDRVWMFPVEADGFGRIRLNISEDCKIEYDSEVLLQFPDQYVQDVARKLENPQED